MMLEDIVDALSGDEGWWHSEGRDAFLQHAHWLERAGMQRAEIQSALEALYRAVAAEFGD